MLKCVATGCAISVSIREAKQNNLGAKTLNSRIEKIILLTFKSPFHMDKEFEVKYGRCKRTVMRWEQEFKKQFHRIPSQVICKIFSLKFLN